MAEKAKPKPVGKAANPNDKARMPYGIPLITTPIAANIS